MQKTCIIIPCYNEVDRLPVEAFDAFSKEYESIYFLFVNDGSKDNTLIILNRLAEGNNRILILNLATNQGKAEAVRRGVQESATWHNFDFTGYFDADLATPLREIHLLLEQINTNPLLEMAFGSRVKRMGTLIERSIVRHYFGRIFSTTASILLKLPVYDTQCGAKLMKAKLAAELFAEPFKSRWFFDIELFARLINKYGYQKLKKVVIEVPLREWLEKGESRLKLKFILKIPLELLHIHRKYKVRKNWPN